MTTVPGISHTAVTSFRRRIFRFYERHGRTFSFRRTHDPYRITISEFMLQQTQIQRVAPRYETWVQRWPDWPSLAGATRRELLQQWTGLGYNRRALYLGEVASRVMNDHGGRLPEALDLLLALPGFGKYTARAVLIFARNHPLVTVDTNIRRLLLHEFSLPVSTSERDLYTLTERLLPRGRSRDWHYALMDYSSERLPRRLAGIGPRTKQKPFRGSQREIRGEIVRRLTIQSSVRVSTVARRLERTEDDVRAAAGALEKDGIITVRGDTLRLKTESAKSS